MADPVLRLGLDARGMRTGAREGVRSLDSIRSSARRTTTQLSQTDRGSRELGDAFGVLSGRATGLRTAFGQLQGALALVGIGLAGRQIIDAGLRFDAMRRSLDAVSGSSAEATAQLARLREVGRLPGISFEEAVRGSVRLQAVGLSAQFAERFLVQMANALAMTGGSADDLGRVIVQIGQLSAKGRVLAQDLRPIIENAPVVGAALREAFGTIDAEEIQRLGLSSEQFLERLTDELAGLQRVSPGLRDALENARSSLDEAADAIVQRLTPAFQSAAAGMERFAGVVVANADTILLAASGLAIMIGGRLTGAFLLSARATVAANIELVRYQLTLARMAGVSRVAVVATTGLRSALALFGGPIGLGITAIAAAFLLIRRRADEATSSIQDATGRMDAFRTSIEGATQAELERRQAATAAGIEMLNVLLAEAEARRALAAMPRDAATAGGILSGGGAPNLRSAPRLPMDVNAADVAINALRQRMEELEQQRADIGKRIGQSILEEGRRTADEQRRLAQEQIQEAQRASDRIVEQFDRVSRARATALEFGVGLDAAPDAVRRSIEQLAQLRTSIDEVRDAMRVLADDSRLAPALADLEQQAEQLGRTITTALGDLPARFAALGDIAPALAPISQAVPTIDALAASFGTLQLRAEAVQRAEESLFLARAAGDPSRMVAAEDALAATRDRLRAATELLVGVIDRSTLSAEQEGQVIEQLRETLQAAGIDVEDLATSTLGLSGALSIIETSGRGILSVADSVGAIGDEARRGLTGVLDLVRGVEELKRVKDATDMSDLATGLGIAGGIGAIAGGLVSIGSALLAGDPERERIMQANTRAIEELSRDFRGFRADTSENLFRALNALEAGVAGAGGNAFRLPQSILSEIVRSGLSMGDLRAIAEEFGVDAFDEEGGLRVENVGAFIDALEIATSALVGFRDTLDDAQRERQLRDRILGVERTPQQQVEALFGDVQRFAPDLFRDFLGGIDTSDTEAVRGSLIDLLDAFAAGGDEFAELMGNLTRDEFLSWLDSAAGSLESLDEVINQTTDAIRNVPSWFRLAGAVLGAADPDPFTPVVPPPPPISQPVNPGPLGGPRTGRPNDGDGFGVPGGIHLTFNVSGAENPEAFGRRAADAATREFERRQLARTGRRQGAVIL